MESRTIEANIDNIDLIIKNFLTIIQPQYSYYNEDKNIYVYIFEKLAWQNLSEVSGTIIFDILENKRCKIIITISGGKTGWLRLTWGSERKMMEKISDFFDLLIDELPEE
ncbi:MAG: hypothetical protein JXA99_09325 [Candidatus Lokiarchaeota archaeon]|nr:hypothetical protein [Candidatus Lokiarchaeota archaeon]